ncbi:TIGR01620 family protein, partial [Aeromonas caviae]
MNDQTRWRTDDAAPLQGKVTLEPAPSMASEAQPPAPARRLE